MKFIITRTSEYGDPKKEVEFSTLEELIAFAKAHNNPIILLAPGSGYPERNDWALEIYDDYRE